MPTVQISVAEVAKTSVLFVAEVAKTSGFAVNLSQCNLNSWRIQLRNRTTLFGLILVAYVLAQQSTLGAVLQLGGGHELEGQVLLPDGKPASDAVVYLLNDSKKTVTLPYTPTKTTSDENGRYNFENVDAGDYFLWSESDSLTSLDKKFEGRKISLGPKDIDLSDLNLQLHEGCRIAVRIRSKATGQLVPNAKISFGWPDIERQFESKAEGEFEIAGLATGDWCVVVESPDFALAFQRVRAEQLGTSKSIEFELEPGAFFKGRVIDSEGDAVEDARISVSIARDGMTPILGRQTTNHNGLFWFTSLPVGKQLKLGIDSDYCELASKEFSIELANLDTVQKFAVNRKCYTGDCIVTVVDEIGNPIAGATITNRVFNPQNWGVDERTGITDSDGVCRIKNLAVLNGRAPALISARGMKYAEVLLEIGTHEEPGKVEVELAEGEPVCGRLVKPNGDPASKVAFNYQAINVPIMGGGVTDNEGRFRVDGLPGPCIFNFRCLPPYLPIDGIQLAVGTDEEQVIAMELQAVIRVKVIDAKTRKSVPNYIAKIIRKNGMLNGWGRYIPNEINMNGGNRILRIERIPEGSVVPMTISAKGYEDFELTDAAAEFEDESEPIVVEMAPKIEIK